MFAESESDVVAELEMNCNLEKDDGVNVSSMVMSSSELAARRVELAGARRRRPKRARGIWCRGIQAS